MQNDYDSRILEVIRYNIITPTGILTVVDHRFKTDHNNIRNKRSRSDADSTLENQYSCKDCDKEFKFHSLVVKHKATHSTERPFECETCSRTYNDKGGLNNHRKRKQQ
jgi:uncharacterized Zn-finger protein